MTRRSVVDDAYDQLAGEILDGALGPGDVLPAERALTELLGVNRQAVREALQRLAQDGLVAIQHGGATRVRDFRQSGGLQLLPRLAVSADGKFDRGVIRSVIELRACLAPDVARLAAARARPDHVAAIEAAASALDDPGLSLADRARRNLDLWDAVVDASDNVAYRLAYNSLRASYEPIAGFLAATIADELDDRAGRARLVAAVRDAKPEAAARAGARLIASSTAALLALVGELPDEVAT